MASAVEGRAKTPQVIAPSHSQPPNNCPRGTKSQAEGKRERIRVRGSSCDPSQPRSRGPSPVPLPRAKSGYAPSSTEPARGLQTIKRFMRGRGLQDLCRTLTVKCKHIPLCTWLGPLSEECGFLTPEVRMSLQRSIRERPALRPRADYGLRGISRDIFMVLQSKISQ